MIFIGLLKTHGDQVGVKMGMRRLGEGIPVESATMFRTDINDRVQPFILLSCNKNNNI